MRKNSSEAKIIISGDYFELGKNGHYRRHTDVSVHCHDNNP